MSSQINVAVLMHGLVGSTNKYGTGEEIDVEIAARHFNEQILAQNPDCKIDVFMHSWSTEAETVSRDLYSPTAHLFEEQIHFDFEYVVGDPNLPMNPGKTENGKFIGIENIRFHSLYSRWYSAKVANALRLIHTMKSGVKYDYVMLTRFDLAYVVPIKFSELSKDKIYVIPPLSHHGIQDLFFICDDQKMNTLCMMFDFLVSIKHYSTWNMHSHYLASNWILEKIGEDKIDFIGPNRLWDAGTAGLKTGPAPLVRDYYGLHKINKEDPMEFKKIEQMRQHVMKNCRQFNKIIKS